MEKLTEAEIKEKKGRMYIAEFLSAMKFHDNDRQTTIKVMRRKLREIYRKDINQSAGVLLIKKRPPTSRKVIIKFSGSQTPPVVQQRRHPPASMANFQPLSQTSLLLSTNNNFSETLVCKRQKINNNEGDLNKVMDFITRIGGSEAQFVIDKRLTSSDVTANQGRLLMPVLGVKNQGFLRAHEKLKKVKCMVR